MIFPSCPYQSQRHDSHASAMSVYHAKYPLRSLHMALKSPLSSASARERCRGRQLRSYIAGNCESPLQRMIDNSDCGHANYLRNGMANAIGIYLQQAQSCENSGRRRMLTRVAHLWFRLCTPSRTRCTETHKGNLCYACTADLVLERMPVMPGFSILRIGGSFLSTSVAVGPPLQEAALRTIPLKLLFRCVL
jgi:hypothetical protein